MKLKRTALAAFVATTLSGTAQASLVFSEYVEGSGNNKALELANLSGESVDLSAWEIQVFFNGSTNAGLTINLEGDIAPGAVQVFASSQADGAILAVADQTSSAGLFNGDDAITLLNGGVVVDSVGQVGTDPGSYWGDDVRTQNSTLRRRDDAAPDADPYDAYEPAAVFDNFPVDSFDGLGQAGGQTDPGDPDDPSDPDAPVLTCGEPATVISAVQGETGTSPLADQAVVIEAVVTGVFTGEGSFDGFYVEEEASDRDSSTLTSEGLFVFGSDQAVDEGQTLRIAGTVTEYNGLTELTGVSGIVGCGAGSLPEPATLALPFASVGAPEALESMRVRTDAPLTVNDNYDLGRYGSLTLGSQRHYIPTNVASPGAPAQAIQQANQLDRILLDDGSNRQNPAAVRYPSPELSAAQTVRAGDQVSDVVAILDYRFDEWRLHPLQDPVFVAANPRTDVPTLAATGNLLVTSFNVLNFFNGDGLGGGFPTDRGADTAEELRRQTDKLVAAIRATDADVVGLMEIENDGYGDNSAIVQLASELGSEWAAVDPGLPQLGGDAITVGFVYRTDRAEPVGDAATLTTAPFQDLNRQPLAQTFRPLGVEDGVTLVVNHFKSKGCGEASGPNAEQGDGQGCWNPVRVEAANALSGWLASDPTGTGESDVLVIGDLNSYAKEDPISVLETAGYTDLIASFVGDTAYSYVFYGQAGYLDHALASPTLLDKVVDATVWAINADEPRALDYNTEFQTPQQQAAYYAPDPWRASDHDPVIVALNLGTSGSHEPADLNADGKVDGRDLARFLLARLFGRTEGLDLNGDSRVNGADMRVILASLLHG